ncbi:MAG: PQQ-dependent sugar dehydrogenase [Rhodocyclaceae bacterium]|nr:PQQ-dependent sugar dehydrogenase [Rhodocyclaceae bacterium]
MTAQAHSPTRLRRSTLAALAIAAIGLTPGCGGSVEVSVNTDEDGGRVEVTTFASGLAYPWGLAFLPDGSLLVTEKPGRLRHVTRGGEVSTAIAGVPAVSYSGQGGLLDVAVDPDFATNRRVYLSYTEAEGGVKGTAVARGVLSADLGTLGNVQVIFRQQPKVGGSGHFGGRLVFAPDGLLFVTLGERQLDGDRPGDQQQAQNLGSHLGKVVRIRSDGTVPDDNPFVNTADAEPEIWSYGHRNPQGAAIHPESGELWAVEHGPQGGDELNIVRKGRNYGWPLISYGCNYGSIPRLCDPVGGASSAPGMEQPISWWVPTSTAPSGLAFYTDARIPEWRGDAFVGALAGQGLWHLELEGDNVKSRELLLGDLGRRIRDVRAGPDGWLYVLTDESNGEILRLGR